MRYESSQVQLPLFRSRQLISKTSPATTEVYVGPSPPAANSASLMQEVDLTEKNIDSVETKLISPFRFPKYKSSGSRVVNIKRLSSIHSTYAMSSGACALPFSTAAAPSSNTLQVSDSCVASGHNW